MANQPRWVSRHVAWVVFAAAFLVCVAGVGAYAALGGTISNLTRAVGAASGSSSSCQSTPLTFTFAGPVWNSAQGKFVVDRLDVFDISAECVAATAQLTVVLLADGNEYLRYSTTPQSSSGSLYLQTLIPAELTSVAQVRYLITQ